MNPEIPKAVRKDLLSVMKKAQRLLNTGKTKQLKHLSDHSIKNITIFQDQDSMGMAVVIYALSKLLERWGVESEYAQQARELLGSAQFSLDQNKVDEYREKMDKLTDFVSTIDQSFKVYVQKVIEKAHIKKGSSLYEYGISAARSAELLGIGPWELMSYVGKTRIHDEPDMTSDTAQRLMYTRSLFIGK